MPRSKRDKNVSLTKTKKKTGRDRKETMVNTIQRYVDDYDNVFVFTVDNLRSAKLISIRQEFKQDSLFCFGKRTLMSKALGRTREEEYGTNLHKITKFIAGQSGLLFTNRPVKDVIKYFANHGENDFARSGNEATATVNLDKGPYEMFPFSIEPHLRKLGLPTSLEKGIVTLTKPHVVCTKGDKLTPEQARILKLLNIQMSTFRVSLVCYWNKKTGSVKRLTKLVAKGTKTPIKKVTNENMET